MITLSIVLVPGAKCGVSTTSVEPITAHISMKIEISVGSPTWAHLLRNDPWLALPSFATCLSRCETIGESQV